MLLKANHRCLIIYHTPVSGQDSPVSSLLMVMSSKYNHFSSQLDVSTTLQDYIHQQVERRKHKIEKNRNLIMTIAPEALGALQTTNLIGDKYQSQ
jgi:hypothetical protein